jgi:hypothetical protein
MMALDRTRADLEDLLTFLKSKTANLRQPPSKEGGPSRSFAAQKVRPHGQ